LSLIILNNLLFFRSMSPIAVRQVSKRRYTASSGNGFGNQSSGSGLDSDGENRQIYCFNY